MVSAQDRYPAAVGREIPFERDVEAALRRSEEQLRLATEAAEIGLWDVDVIEDTLFWTPRVKAMFGISPSVPVSMADFTLGCTPMTENAFRPVMAPPPIPNNEPFMM